MSSRWSNPVVNNLLFKKDGAIEATGSVEFFEAGTSTALAVYSDEELTTSLGSVLDTGANGLLPDFHMAAGTKYKMVAYDAAGGSGGGGAELWTRDDVFPIDSSTDARLDALEGTVNGLSITRNACINGGMRVDFGSAHTLDATFTEGVVKELLGRVTNVTAGTLNQGSDLDYASNKYAHFSGVTTSSSGVVEAQIRIPADEAARFVDGPVTFSCLVNQDTGGDITYTVTLKKPTVADDFSTLTTFGTSSGDSVSSGVDTRLSFSIADAGDVSNGIAVEVSAAVGTITTKNFRITEAQVESGGTRTAFVETDYQTAVVAVAGRDRANHTGTQDVSTITGLGTLATLNNVGFSELDTSVGSVTNAGATANFALPGGQHGFYPRVRISAGLGSIQIGLSIANTSYSTNITLATNCSAEQTYMNASPPYNLGHGDISQFMFVQVDSSDNIQSVWAADVAPWVYNGKTSVTPDYIDRSGSTVKKYRKLPVASTGEIPLHPLEGGNMQEYADFIANQKTELVEITPDFKNIDMVDIPHPFVGVPSDHKVILLDPISPITDQLAILHKQGDDITQLIMSGLVVIGEEITDCNKPPSVSVHRVSWRAK